MRTGGETRQSWVALVHVTEPVEGVKSGTWRMVGKVFEAAPDPPRCADGPVRIAGKEGRCSSSQAQATQLDDLGKWVAGPQRLHSSAQAADVEGVDGKGSVAALRAARPAHSQSPEPPRRLGNAASTIICNQFATARGPIWKQA